MADSCIISKEQLSQKEQALKSKLYGGATTLPPKQTVAPLTTGKVSSPKKAMEYHKQQLQTVTDQKMDNFLDDMRNQFVKSSGSSVIPQSLLF